MQLARQIIGIIFMIAGGAVLVSFISIPFPQKLSYQVSYVLFTLWLVSFIIYGVASGLRAASPAYGVVTLSLFAAWSLYMTAGALHAHMTIPNHSPAGFGGTSLYGIPGNVVFILLLVVNVIIKVNTTLKTQES